MGDARAAASNSDDAAATVAPLAELWRRSAASAKLQRTARALELARRTLPPNNLVAAWITGDVLVLHTLRGHEEDVASIAASGGYSVEFDVGVWDSDPRLTTLSCERLAACCARFEAGTLFAPTLEEQAFFSALVDLPDMPQPERFGEEFLLFLTNDAVGMFAIPDVKQFEVLSAGINATLLIALTLDRRGQLDPWMRKREAVRLNLARVLNYALGENTAEAKRAQCADIQSHFFPPVAEAELRRLQARLPTAAQIRDKKPSHVDPASLAASNARAAADVARLGLNTCAFPTCGAKEPHPRFFKCCSRCRTAWYCCVAHQRADYPRHRDSDGCTKPAAS
jgi:hypothetical protein